MYSNFHTSLMNLQRIVGEKKCNFHICLCTEFTWQWFGSRRTTGVASVRRDQEPDQRWTEPVPDSSSTDPSLGKAEPISDVSGASVITNSRKRKSAVRGRGEKKCERRNPADTKVSEEGGGAAAPGTGAEIPLQPMVKTVARQVVLLQPMEEHSGADDHPAAYR